VKIIREEYWEENFGSENIPTPLQKAWVQRWLELMDANTSYLFSLNTVKLPYLIRDFLNLKYNRHKGERDYSRFLIEINNYYFKNETEKELLRIYFGKDNEQSTKDLLSCLTKYSEDYKIKDNFYENGYRKSKNKVPNFEDNMKACIEKNDPNFSKILKNLKLNIESDDMHISQFRKNICEFLYEKLLNDVNEANWYNQFEIIDLLTQMLILNLIIYSGYSFEYLTKLCREYFVSKKSEKISFNKELKKFLNEFCENMTESDKMFNIYFRIQAKQIIKNIDRFSEVKYSDQFKTEKNELGSFENYKDLNTNKFFYSDIEKKHPEQLVLAIIYNIDAPDPFSAAAKGYDILSNAIQQAKFECELRGFNIDNRICVANLKSKTLTFFSRKILNPTRYGTIGDTIRLKKLLTKLAIAEVKQNKADQEEKEKNKKNEIIRKLRQITFKWHENAIETENNLSRFLNHWIALEHLFNTLEPLKIDQGGEIYQVKTGADKMVIGFNNILSNNWKTKILIDLWGDIRRSKILGINRVVAPSNDKLEHKEKNKYYINSKIIKLLPEAQLLVEIGEKVIENTWIACSSYPGDNIECKVLKKIFSKSSPKLENILFLIIYGDRFSYNNFFDETIQKNYLKNGDQILKAIRLFDELESIIQDLSEYTNYLDNISDLKENSLPDTFKF